MNPSLEIILNDNLILEYPRNTRLPGKQREFLDIMDHDMNEGIKLDGNIIHTPDSQNRIHYIALQLIQAMKSNNRGMIMASCAYLINRQPTLQQIRAWEVDDTISLELIYDKNSESNG